MPAGEAEGPAGDPADGQLTPVAAGEAAGDPPPATRKRPRGKPKTAPRALARAEALSGAGGVDAFAELANLRRSVDQLRHALGVMLQTQETHSEMLRALLVAATAPIDPENQVMAALRYISGQIGEQGGRFAELQSTLNRLPEAVAVAVAAQMATALEVR